MLIGFTDNFQIHYANGRITIYDKRMNKHLPISFEGEEAQAFKKSLDELAERFPDDDTLYSAINGMCELMRKQTNLRPQ